MLADFAHRSSGQPEVFEKRLVLLRVAGLEERVQALFLSIGDAGFVEEGDELIFRDGFHILMICRTQERAGTRKMHCEAVGGSSPMVFCPELISC